MVERIQGIKIWISPVVRDNEIWFENVDHVVHAPVDAEPEKIVKALQKRGFKIKRPARFLKSLERIIEKYLKKHPVNNPWSDI